MKDREGQRSTKLKKCLQNKYRVSVLFGLAHLYVYGWIKKTFFIRNRGEPNVLFIDTRTKSVVIKTNEKV